MKKLVVIFTFLCVTFFSSFSQIDSLLEIASQAFLNSDCQTAVKFYKLVLKEEPNSIEALLGIGNCALNNNDTSQALFYYQKALKFEPENEDVNLALSQYYFSLGQYQNAKAILLRYFYRHPVSWLAADGLSSVYLYLNQPDSARYFFDIALKLSTDKSFVYSHLSEVYYNLEQYDSAKYYISKAIRNSPDDGFLYMQKYKIDVNLGDYKNSLIDLDSAIGCDSTNVMFYLEKLSLFFYTKLYDSVINYGFKVLNSFRDTSIYFLIANSYIAKNQYDSAKVVLQRGISCCPGASLYYLLGKVLKVQRKLAEAYLAFSSAAEIEPWILDYQKQMICTKFLINSTDIDTNLEFSNITSQSLRKLIRLSKSKKSKYYYPRLLAKFYSAPFDLDLVQYFMLYLGRATSRNFSASERYNQVVEVRNLYRLSKFNEAIAKAKQYLAADPTNFGLYYYLSMIYYLKKDWQDFKKTYIPYIGFILALNLFGDGTGEDDPIISASAIDEIIYLKFIGYDQLYSTDVLVENAHQYRVYTVAKDGEVRKYFFDIDLYEK